MDGEWSNGDTSIRLQLADKLELFQSVTDYSSDPGAQKPLINEPQAPCAGFQGLLAARGQAIGALGKNGNKFRAGLAG